MLFRFMSDLHLEHDLNAKNWLDAIPADLSASLLLAGDVAAHYHLESVLRLLASKFKQVIFVPGNTDYYGTVCNEFDAVITHKLRDCENVKVLNNDYVMIDGIKVIGSTLWSQIPNNARPTMIDFRNILWKDEKICKFEAKHWRAMFDASLAFLHKEVCRDSIVVTHFLPLFTLISRAHCHTATDLFYASNLEHLFLREPSVWVCGHSHMYGEVLCEKTRVLRNCRGVFSYDPCNNFDVSASFVTE